MISLIVLITRPMGSSTVRMVRIDQSINASHIFYVLKWARASIDDSHPENDVSVTGLFCQCSSKGTCVLLEADGNRLSMYTGLNFSANVSPNPLQDMTIVGFVLQKKATLERFAHKIRSQLSKKPLGS